MPCKTKWVIRYWIIVFTLVYGVFPALALGQCAAQDQRDLDAFYHSVKTLTDSSPLLSQRVLGKVNHGEDSYPIILVSFNPAGETSRSVFISSGLHGDEPAGTESVLVYMGHVISRPLDYKGVRMDFIPLVNPTGWADCDRLTAAGVDINRQYHLHTGREVVIVESFLQQKRYDLMIDHHGDPRDHVDGFYIVTYGNYDLQPLKATLVRQAKLGAPCRVKVPVGKGLTTHPYRVLRLWRSSV